MNRWFFGAFLLLGFAAYVWAADNSTLPVSGGGTEVFANKDIGGVKFPKQIPYNSSGTELFTSGNAGYTQFPSAQAVTISSGTVTTVTTLTGGGVASGSADSGNPVKTGGKYNSSPVTLTDGNRGDLQLDVNGYLKTNVTNANTNGQATMANSSPVVIASNQTANALWGQGATGAAAPANAVQAGVVMGQATTGGKLTAPIMCDNHVFKHITSATDTVAVQGVTSQTIYVCSWRSRAAGVATWYLENTASTNNNCSSTLTQITGVATEAANTGETWGSGFWSGLKNTSGNGLCINSTGTGGVDIDIWYTQF